MLRRVERSDLAAEPDRPVVGRDHAREHLDQGDLAGAVVADQRGDLTGVRLEAGSVQRRHVPVALDDALGFEHHGHDLAA